MTWTQARMKELAAEERGELGLGPGDLLDVGNLCEAHGVHVYTLQELTELGLGFDAVDHFTRHRKRAWSAALIPLGTARVIVENESHAYVRRRSSIAHEMGHFLLEHEFDAVILGEDHGRQFNPKVEKEATFLAGELLVPHEAVERMAFRKWTNAQVAERFHVSEQFAQMRMRGQRVRAARAATKYGFS
jgi:hypothetical protein